MRPESQDAPGAGADGDQAAGAGATRAFGPDLAEALLVAALGSDRAGPDADPLDDEALMALVEGDAEDAAWCETLIADPDLRADVFDVRTADRDVTPEDTLTPRVRRAALSAFERAAVVAESPDATRASLVDLASERVRRSAAPEPAFTWTLGWRAVAALLLVAFGVTIVALSSLWNDSGSSAEAGLRVDSLTRFDGRGQTQFEPGSVVRVGEVFAPRADQVITFGFGDTSHVVAREGDTLRVASGAHLPPDLLARVQKTIDDSGLDMDLAAFLRLEAGEALLEAGADRPVFLAVGDDSLLVLLQGACHVAIDPGAGSKAGPAIALEADGRATFYRAASGDREAARFPLTGPTRVLLGPDGPVAFGSPAASLFRDLKMFGGDLHDANGTREYRVPAAMWRHLSGPARRTGERFRVPAQMEAGESVAMAWRPVASLSAAHAVRVAFRGPTGTRLVLRAGAEDKQTAIAEVVLADDTRDEEPGILTVELALPEDWLSRVGSGELVLEFHAPVEQPQASAEAAQGRWAWFDGLAFVLGQHSNARDDSKTGDETTDGPGR